MESEEESFGRKTKFLLTKPNYLIFVDETGDDTSQKSDGNRGGEKFVVGVGNRALLSSSFDSSHWTTLGFTLGDGRPLLCVIIFACTEVDAKMRMGIQPWCEVQGDLVQDMAANSHGPDKYFPYGPTCTVDGVAIPCYVTCSENGSITSEILTDILKHIDSFKIFDRREATPFLLMDGHGSRFGLSFWST